MSGQWQPLEKSTESASCFPRILQKTMNTHKKLSFIKSAIRITGYFLVMAAMFENSAMVLAGGILIVSEIVGIFEEMGE